ncbi:unnamed protein product [Rhizophagus irregularis]|nr:unnamed protein product [Rhizophagus irregularis]
MGKLRIAKLEKQIQDMERRERNQLNQRRNNRGPINYDKVTCYRCNRRGHFANRCLLGDNSQRNERRVNFINVEDYQEDNNYDYEDYEESDDNDYDYENNEYDDPQLYSYDRDLYEKDNLVQERRRSNRLNPTQGWKTFGKPNLDEEILKRKGEEQKYRNRVETPMEEEERQTLYSREAEPNIPKGYRYSKKRGEYYDSMEGINKWRAAGGTPGPRKDKTKGVNPTDPVLELKDKEKVISVPVWYIRQIEDPEESDYESESEESDYEQEEEKKLYTMKKVIKEKKETTEEEGSQEDSESSSEESSSDDSELINENEN